LPEDIKKSKIIEIPLKDDKIKIIENKPKKEVK
jgi:hypothetical protein